MKWEHMCSLDWLRERQSHLTASDVRSLVPLTKTGRKRTVTDEDRIKVYASKMVQLTTEDCLSTGVMARGHMLEPYAVSEFNRDPSLPTMYWWDDRLVTDGSRSLAFSPDAMDVAMWSGDKPSAIAEVKSYEPSRHMVTATTPRHLIDERWQIATAMAVCEDIRVGYLVLYCPRLSTNRMVVITYERDCLEDEIAEILRVEAEWDDFMDKCLLLPPGAHKVPCIMSEQDIMMDIERASGVNPV